MAPNSIGVTNNTAQINQQAQAAYLGVSRPRDASRTYDRFATNGKQSSHVKAGRSKTLGGKQSMQARGPAGIASTKVHLGVDQASKTQYNATLKQSITMNDKSSVNEPRVGVCSSRMRSKHHRPVDQSQRYAHDDRSKKMMAHSLQEARQKGGKVNNTGGGPLSISDDRDQIPAKGSRQHRARFPDVFDDKMIEEAQDCAEILDFVFGFKPRKRHRTDDDDASVQNDADGALSQDSVPASQDTDMNGGQFKRPFNKWSARPASSQGVSATQADGAADNCESGPSHDTVDGKGGDKVTADGFKIPLATTHLKKGEFESPYRHYKLETTIKPHHLTSNAVAVVPAKSEQAGQTASGACDPKAANGQPAPAPKVARSATVTAQFGYNLYSMPVLKNLTMHDYRLLYISDSAERPYFFGLGMPSRFNCNRGFPVKETPTVQEPSEIDQSSLVGVTEQSVNIKVPSRVHKSRGMLNSSRLPKGSQSRRAMKHAEKSSLPSGLTVDGALSLQKMQDPHGTVGDNRTNSGITEMTAASNLHDKSSTGQGEGIGVQQAEGVPSNTNNAGQHGLRLRRPRPGILGRRPGGRGTGRASNAQPKIFKCPLESCGKIFYDRASLKKHNTVHGDKLFQCTHEGCGKRFLDNAKLKRHMLVHTGEKPYKCDLCGKRFSLDFNLKTHMRIHTGEKPFSCPYQGCNKRFNQKSNLHAHQLTHHLEGGALSMPQSLLLNSLANSSGFDLSAYERYALSTQFGPLLKEPQMGVPPALWGQQQKMMYANSMHSSAGSLQETSYGYSGVDQNTMLKQKGEQTVHGGGDYGQFNASMMPSMVANQQNYNKSEKFQQDIQRIQIKNNGRIFVTKKVEHVGPPESPFFVSPSHASDMLSGTSSMTIAATSLANYQGGLLNVNDLVNGQPQAANLQGNAPALLFDKSRGQLMTTLNMHPIGNRLVHLAGKPFGEKDQSGAAQPFDASNSYFAAGSNGPMKQPMSAPKFHIQHAMHRNPPYLGGFVGNNQAETHRYINEPFGAFMGAQHSKMGGGAPMGLFTPDGAGSQKFSGPLQQGFMGDSFGMLNSQDRFYIDPPLLDRSNIELVHVNGSNKIEPEAVARSAAEKAKTTPAATVDFAPPFRIYFAPKPFCSLHCHLLTNKQNQNN